MLCITICNINSIQITDISTLQFIRKLHNFMHIISMQSNRAARGVAKAANTTETRNSSGDEIANVNFLYDDIVHAVKIQ